jgi:hypothetical protein
MVLHVVCQLPQCVGGAAQAVCLLVVASCAALAAAVARVLPTGPGCGRWLPGRGEQRLAWVSNRARLDCLAFVDTVWGVLGMRALHSVHAHAHLCAVRVHARHLVCSFLDLLSASSAGSPCCLGFRCYEQDIPVTAASCLLYPVCWPHPVSAQLLCQRALVCVQFRVFVSP